MARRKLGTLIRGLLKRNKKALEFANDRRDEVLEDLIKNLNNMDLSDLEENEEKNISDLAQIAYDTNNVTQIRSRLLFVINNLTELIKVKQNADNIEELNSKLENTKNFLDDFDKEVEIIRQNEPDITNQVDKLLLEAFENDLEEKLKNRFEKMKSYAENFTLTEQRELDLALEVNEFIENENLDPIEKEIIRIKLMGKYEKRIKEELGTQNLDFIEKYASKFHHYVNDLETLAPNTIEFKESYTNLINLIKEMQENDLEIEVTFDENTQNLSIKYPEEKIRTFSMQIVPSAYISLVNGENTLDETTQKEQDKQKLRSGLNKICADYLEEIKKMLRGESYDKEKIEGDMVENLIDEENINSLTEEEIDGLVGEYSDAIILELDRIYGKGFSRFFTKELDYILYRIEKDINENVYEYNTEEFNFEYDNLLFDIEKLKNELNQKEDYKKFIQSIDVDENRQTLIIRFKGTAPNYERQIVSNEILEKMRNDENRTLRKTSPASTSSGTQKFQTGSSFNQQPPFAQPQPSSGQQFQSGADFSQPSSSQFNQPQPVVNPFLTPEEQQVIENYLNGIDEMNSIVELINELNANLISQGIYDDIEIDEAQRTIDLEKQAKDLDKQLMNLKVELSKERLQFKQRFNKYITAIPEVKEKTMDEIYFDGNLNDFITQHDEMMVETESKILDLDEERKMYPDSASEINREIDVLLKFIEAQNSLIGRRLVSESKDNQSFDLVNVLKTRRENKRDMRNRLRKIKEESKNYQTSPNLNPQPLSQDPPSIATPEPTNTPEERYSQAIKNILNSSMQRAVEKARICNEKPRFVLSDEEINSIEELNKKEEYKDIDIANISDTVWEQTKDKFFEIIQMENIAARFKLQTNIKNILNKIKENDVKKDNFLDLLSENLQKIVDESYLDANFFLDMKNNTCQVELDVMEYDFNKESFIEKKATYTVKILSEPLLSIYRANNKPQEGTNLDPLQSTQQQPIAEPALTQEDQQAAKSYEIAVRDILYRSVQASIMEARSGQMICFSYYLNEVKELDEMTDKVRNNVNKEEIFEKVYAEMKNLFEEIVEKELIKERNQVITAVRSLSDKLTIEDVQDNMSGGLNNFYIQLVGIVSQYLNAANAMPDLDLDKNTCRIEMDHPEYNFSIEKFENRRKTYEIKNIMPDSLYQEYLKTKSTSETNSQENNPVPTVTPDEENIKNEYTTKLRELFDKELKRLVEEGRNLSALAYKKSYFSDIATNLNSQYDFDTINNIYAQEVEYYDNLFEKIRTVEKHENLRDVNNKLVNFFRSIDKNITYEELRSEISNVVNKLKEDWKVNITEFSFDKNTNSYILTCNEDIYDFQTGRFEPKDRIFTKDNLLKDYVLKALLNSMNPEQATSTTENTRLEQIKEEYAQKLKEIYRTELSNRKSAIRYKNINRNLEYLRQSLQALEEEYKTEFMDEEIADNLRKLEKEYENLYTEILRREKITALEYIKDQFDKIGINDIENLEEKVEDVRRKSLKDVCLANLELITDLEHNVCFIHYWGEVYDFDEDKFENRDIEIPINEFIFPYILKKYEELKKSDMLPDKEEMEQQPSMEENREKYRKQLREDFTEKLKEYIENVRKGQGNGSDTPFANSIPSSLIEENFRDIYEEEVKEYDKTYLDILYTEQISALNVLRNELCTNIYFLGDENKPNFKENLLNKLNKRKNKFVHHFKNLEVIPDLANNRLVIKYYGKQYNFETSSFEDKSITSVEKLLPEETFERIKTSRPETTKINIEEYRAQLQKALDAELEMHIKNIREGKYSLQEIDNIDFSSVIYDTQKMPGDNDYAINILNKMQKPLLEKINQKFMQIITTEKLDYLTEIREEIRKIEVPENLGNFEDLEAFINKNLKEIENRYQDKCKDLMLTYKGEENSCIIGYESMMWNFEKNDFDEWSINGGVIDNIVPEPIYQYYNQMQKPEPKITIEARNLTFNPRNEEKITSNYNNLIITGDALTISLIKNGIKIKYSEHLKDKLSELNAKLSLVNKSEKRGRKNTKNIEHFTDEQDMTITSKKEFNPEDYKIEIRIPDGNKDIPLYEYDLENVSEELKSHRR